jgi:hypothetical protein
MTSNLCLCAAALTLMVLPGAATAQGITYDCDTAANHFSELVLPAGGAPFTVSGKVQLNTLAGSKTYVPIVRIQVTAPTTPGQAPAVFAGFSLSALATDPKKTPSGASSIQMLSYNVNGKEDEILPLTMMTKPGTVQAFTLSYDGSNVSVDLGVDSKSFPLKTAEPVVRIMCSTGEFLLTDVMIKASK